MIMCTILTLIVVTIVIRTTDKWCVNRINYYRSRRDAWTNRICTSPIPDDLMTYVLEKEKSNNGGNTNE